jgi:uncharacterized MAPEG superfamily protein
VSPGNIFNELSPHARVFTAVMPFALALFVRILLGNNQLTRWLISLSVLWFAANILMAPYAAGMRQDLRNLRTLLP